MNSLPLGDGRIQARLRRWVAENHTDRDTGEASAVPTPEAEQPSAEAPMLSEEDSGGGRKECERRAHPRILIVDDDTRLLSALSLALSQQGFRPTTAADAGAALKMLEDDPVDAVVLDVMMPVVDGLQFCKLVRPRFQQPILMLSAMSRVDQRISGLEAGADDYLVKPFAVAELAARLRVLLRRSKRAETANPVVTFGDIVLDTYRWAATRAGDVLVLTSKEFRILEALMRQPGRAFTREEMLRAAWGDDEQAESNVVDVHVGILRQKLEAGGRPRLIQTIRGVGYSLRE